MARPPFNPPKAGDGLNIYAAEYTAFLANLRDTDRRHAATISWMRYAQVALVHNASETDLAPYNVIQLSGVRVEPPEYDTSASGSPNSKPLGDFLRGPQYSGDVPVWPHTSGGNLAVTLGDIPAGRVGRCVVGGQTPCRVIVNATDDQFVRAQPSTSPASSRVEFLTTVRDASGSARIIWRQDPNEDGAAWAVIDLDSPSGHIWAKAVALDTIVPNGSGQVQIYHATTGTGGGVTGRRTVYAHWDWFTTGGEEITPGQALGIVFFPDQANIPESTPPIGSNHTGWSIFDAECPVDGSEDPPTGCALCLESYVNTGTLPPEGCVTASNRLSDSPPIAYDADNIRLTFDANEATRQGVTVATSKLMAFAMHPDYTGTVPNNELGISFVIYHTATEDYVTISIKRPGEVLESFSADLVVTLGFASLIIASVGDGTYDMDLSGVSVNGLLPTINRAMEWTDPIHWSGVDLDHGSVAMLPCNGAPRTQK